MQNLQPANISIDSHNNEHAAEKCGLRFDGTLHDKAYIRLMKLNGKNAQQRFPVKREIRYLNSRMSKFQNHCQLRQPTLLSRNIFM